MMARIYYGMGKGTKLRNIYLLPEVVKIIECMCICFTEIHLIKDEYLFYLNYNGNRHKLSPEAINKRLKIYAKSVHATCSEMPENIYCHNLRSARATLVRRRSKRINDTKAARA